METAVQDQHFESADDDDTEDDTPDEDTLRRMSMLETVMQRTASNAYTNMSSAKRLTKELLACYEAQTFDAELVDDNLYEWIVRISSSNLDQQSALFQDLKKRGGAIDVRLSFPQDFPFTAPFAYLRRPRLKCKYVFDGALCMELLIHWNPAHSSVEAILVQICTVLTEGEARVDPDHDADYGEDAARKVFQGLKAFHDKRGWGAARNR